MTINSLNKEIIDRMEEMNKMRKEYSQMKLEVSDCRQKMSAEALVLSQSYSISPYDVLIWNNGFSLGCLIIHSKYK